MEKPLVSIAMATYNGEKFLREQLDSIYNQTYENIEVIISDDCSTDGTVKILEEYKKKYGLKYFLNDENVGISKNFERAIKRCQGQYIAKADQDDVWVPRKIEILVNNIGSFSLICSSTYLIDEKGKFLGKYKLNHFAIPTEKIKQFRLLLRREFTLGNTILFKKELLAKLLPIPIKVEVDRWCALVATKMNGIKYLDKPLVCYRQHQDNISGRTKAYSFSRKITAFFIDRRENSKRMYMRIRVYRRIMYLMKSSLFNESERAYLKEALEYYNSFIEGRPLKAITLEIKNRHVWYPGSNFLKFLERWIWIFIPLLDNYFTKYFHMKAYKHLLRSRGIF